MPKEVETLQFSATFFDASTGILHQSEWAGDVRPGRLAFIELPDSGTEVAADDFLDLNPVFKDAYNNIIPDVAVNWTVSSFDKTLEIRMAGGKWYPTETGEHEIRANADGVLPLLVSTSSPEKGLHLLPTAILD